MFFALLNIVLVLIGIYLFTKKDILSYFKGGHLWLTWLAIGVIMLSVFLFIMRNKRWDDVEHFKRVQRKWAIAGLVLLLAPIVAILVAVFVLGGLR